MACQGVRGSGHARILGRDILERGAHQLGVDGMAGGAGFALEQRRPVLGSHGRLHAQRSGQGEQ
ncbi:hypothetical protein D3C73_1628950 [compost metagenome]